MKLAHALRLSLLASLIPWGAQAAESSIHFDTPVGGWRAGDGDKADFRQTVNYPASSVSTRADQAETARIRGEIRSLPKDNKDPARLVVNGVAMPLKVDDNGGFDRPFAFPAGTNSVEVISPDGQQRKHVQFYHGGGGGEVPAKLRVLLSWDSDNTDLDLHLVTPDGGHVWYGNRSLSNGAAQDVDVTTGYGPEIIASPTPLKGQYLVYVNYYGGGWSEDDSSGDVNAAKPLTTAQVTIVTEEGTVNEKQESFLIPMRQPGELTLVKRFSYP
ncbi:YfaP family protein [Pseudomonas sp. NY15181]|uniref:YfaP family protein n=1 Tax=Pseudomonas sp. NY15181 TaxID=3400349 RepID=UPI003A871153